MRTVIRHGYEPKNLDYCNRIVQDVDSGKAYIFDCDGVFTTIPADRYDEILQKAKVYTDEEVSALRIYLEGELNNKVDKEEGKGLSTNDYTNADKEKLDSLGKTLTIIDNEETVTYDGTEDVEIEISHLDPTLYYTKTETDDLLDDKADKATTYTKTETDGLISAETESREAADNNLQSQIDAITASSDVVDIVGTYAELQNYDTTSLSDNDIVKVLSDSTHGDATSYYRWDKDNSTWEYVGSEGPYYTKAETDNLLNDKQDTLTTGDNISIVNNVISATDTTYTAGNGITLSGTEFSADTSVLATKQALDDGLQELGEELDTKADKDDVYTKSEVDEIDALTDRLHVWLVDPNAEDIIAPNSDLNDIEFLKVGTRFINRNEDVRTLLNSPTTESFTLRTYNVNNEHYDNEETARYQYRLQEVVDIQGHTWTRRASAAEDAGEWTYTAWKRTLQEGDAPTYTAGNGISIINNVISATGMTKQQILDTLGYTEIELSKTDANNNTVTVHVLGRVG